MNPRELVDHIRSGPTELVLDEPLRFRRRTRSNPCDFNEFLQALQSSETIRDVQCGSQLKLGIAEDEWVLLVKTVGNIKGIQDLKCVCKPGSRDFHPFQALAEAVNSARSLSKLVIGLEGETVPRYSSGQTALACALRENTGLQEFNLIDCCFVQEVAQNTALDPVLRALSACPHIQQVFVMSNFASADAVKNLLQLPTDTSLRLALKPDLWLVVADEICQGRCLTRDLMLWMAQSSCFAATEAVKAVANAIRRDRHLESIALVMENGFTDEAGVALAEALTINKTLRIILLDEMLFISTFVLSKASLGAQAYEAFGAMLRVNTGLDLELPTFDANASNEMDIGHFKQMRIEQRLNGVGRGRLLASSQTPREEWVNALQKLNGPNIRDLSDVNCMYSLLRLHPDVCML
jgi:hypothetical protein